MEYLFGLKLWDNPRLGVFRVETGEKVVVLGRLLRRQKKY